MARPREKEEERKGERGSEIDDKEMRVENLQAQTVFTIGRQNSDYFW